MARRHSLLIRLLAMSIVVAGCSIAATAWLASQSTSGSIRQEYGEALDTDTSIYDKLMEYAATHHEWAGAQDLVRALAAQYGRRIALTSQTKAPVLDSAGPTGRPLPTNPTTTLDPMSVNAAFKPAAAKDGIDSRAVGPFQLTSDERDGLERAASAAVGCLQKDGGNGTVTHAPNGRPILQVTSSTGAPTSASVQVVAPPRSTVTQAPDKPTSTKSPGVIGSCDDQALTTNTATEQHATDQLIGYVNDCLKRDSHPGLVVDPKLGVDQSDPNAKPSAKEQKDQQLNRTSPTFVADLQDWADTHPEAKACVTTARDQQLRPFVSPPALLFVTNEVTGEATPTGLSTVGTRRLAGTAAIVLVLTVGVAMLAASRLVRPINALTSATRRMGGGDRSARVRTRGRGEIGELATAFNTMSEQLARTEDQRRAMVSDVAHELRAPLANIRGWLEAAQDDVAELDDELVSSLLEETLLLQHLVDDLQDLALADAGRLRLHTEPLAVGDLVEQVVAAHRARAEAAGLALSVTAEPDLEITGDPTRLRQALGNLVTNALRYTPAGGSVEVTAASVRDRVLITVRDTGIGIDAEELPHVFDRFWRAEKSRNRQTGGSGLGLAITRHLVEAHGGAVTVRSTPGEGSAFTIALPASR
ncbi:HAMP domain-containing protein [Solihabitans fulvus]|uniref:histidine kinase n=1 Tax=Solihabitans fulvus TaxID=1892852 RepID=A0A5B2XI44_9PSEU|nr:ATP-binding protein [Solihabitans fulvus]KAA2263477.1 HAMP domain-containing protein [Solihabitans fulvus]